MKRLLFALLLCLGIGCGAQEAQAVPSGCPYPFQYGQVLTTAEANACMGAIVNGFTGGTLTSELTLAPSSTLNAGLNCGPPGNAPVTPQTGDIWCLTTGIYYNESGPGTIGPLAPGGTNGQVQINNGSGGWGGINSASLTALLSACSATIAGAVPTPPNSTTEYLNGSCAWSTPSGTGGTVTTTGSPTSGELTKFSGATSITNAVSGTDYAPATSGTSLLYGNGSGGFSNVTIGTNISFTGGTLSASGGATPGGSSTDVQRNLSGAFSGDSGFTYDGSGNVTATNSLNVTAVGNVTTPEITLGANGTYPTTGNASMFTVTSAHSSTPGFEIETAGIGRADYNITNGAAWTLAGSFIALPSGSGCGATVGIAISSTLDTGLTTAGAANTLEACAHIAGTIWDYNVNNSNWLTLDKATILDSALISGGTLPTLTGTCTTGSLVGGGFAGTFAATCTAQTVIITFGTTAPNGYSCNAHDLTTPADVLNQTASSATSCTLTGTTVASDSVSYNAVAY